jgi:hypothetical protein
MHYLIAESVSLKPHLETAGEVALQALSDGHEVGFAWLGEHLPWSDWSLPAIARWVGCSLERREHMFERLLAKEGVSVLEQPADDSAWQSAVAEWARSFKGDLGALKQYSYQGVALGAGAASSLISYTGNSCYEPLEDLDRARACLAAALLVYLRAERVIHTFKPDVVITFNGRFATSKPIVSAAERAGVKVLRHERGCTYSHYELFSDTIHNFGYIRRRIQEAWDAADPCQRMLLGHQFFQRRRGGDGIGWYSFTTGQEKGRVPDRVTGKRRLVYFSSSDDEYAAVADAYEPGPWPDQLSAVRDLIATQRAYSDLELVIRVHPHLVKKSAAERERWAQLSEAGVDVIAPHETVDSYALIDSADIVASYGSTIGMEAAYWGKPSVLLGPCAYRGSGAVLAPADKNEIQVLLDPANPPAVPMQENCLPYGHYYLSYGRKFRYYGPESLSEGRLLGHRLGWDPWLVHMLRKMRVGEFYRNVKKHGSSSY